MTPLASTVATASLSEVNVTSAVVALVNVGAVKASPTFKDMFEGENSSPAFSLVSDASPLQSIVIDSV